MQTVVCNWKNTLHYIHVLCVAYIFKVMKELFIKGLGASYFTLYHKSKRKSILCIAKIIQLVLDTFLTREKFCTDIWSSVNNTDFENLFTMSLWPSRSMFVTFHSIDFFFADVSIILISIIYMWYTYFIDITHIFIIQKSIFLD